MESDRTELKICEDCVLYHATGDLPPDRDREFEILSGEEELGRLDPDFEDGGEGYEEFSSNPCEACGVKDPGSRYRAWTQEAL